MDEIEIVEGRAVRALGGEPSRSAALSRLRHGAFASASDLEAASVEQRYLARVRAAAAFRPAIVFALESALAIHGLPFGSEPAFVFSTGDPNAPGSRAGIRNSHLPIRDEHVVDVGGLRCSSVAWTLADVARRRLPSDAVSAIDAALRAGVVTQGRIAEALAWQSRQGRPRARWSIAFADALSESVGESRSRVAIAMLGFPSPELQVRTPTAAGVFWSDFGWDRDGRPLLGEFDGAVKYGAIAQAAGRTGAAALAAEKRREDSIRQTADVVRWVWGDVADPRRLERILRVAGLPQHARMLPTGVRLLR